MKWFILIFLLGCGSHSAQKSAGKSNSITLFHYNIKELSTVKIESAQNQQMDSLAKVLKHFQSKHGKIDLFSLNEVQFDQKGIPNKNYTSHGQNLNKIAERLELNFHHSIFSEANTGKLAKKDKQGNYLQDFSAKNSRKLADQINFGIFPGQYSTGALSNMKVISVSVIDKLLWKEFNPHLDLNQFRLADGKKVPEDIQLFDKNFTDIVLETVLENKKKIQFHLILLHSVPAYHFGNKRSMNFLRNADQLKFLEWYLTGKTDFGVPKIIDDGNRIVPLPADARFIAVGDWNTAPDNFNNPGSWVLKRLFKKTTPWMNPKKMSFTNESGGFGQKPLRLMLDYIVVDKKTKIESGGILHPKFADKQPVCQSSPFTKGSLQPTLYVDPSNELRLIQFKQWSQAKKQNLHCYTYVSESYFHFKQASDHFPIFVKFKL